jgi:uncharacterized protein YjlB
MVSVLKRSATREVSTVDRMVAYSVLVCVGSDHAHWVTSTKFVVLPAGTGRFPSDGSLNEKITGASGSCFRGGIVFSKLTD